MTVPLFGTRVTEDRPGDPTARAFNFPPMENLERWQSGLSQHPAKVLNLYWVSRVRIPPSPHLDPIVQWTEPAASIRLIQVRLLFGSPPFGPLAQWSEPAAHNSQGAGSSPAGPTHFRRRKPVRLTNDSRCFDGISPIFWQDKSRAPKAPCRGLSPRAKMAYKKSAPGREAWRHALSVA